MSHTVAQDGSPDMSAYMVESGVAFCRARENGVKRTPIVLPYSMVWQHVSELTGQVPCATVSW